MKVVSFSSENALHLLAFARPIHPHKIRTSATDNSYTFVCRQFGIEYCKEMKIAILGFGREGRSLLKFLRKTRINADYHADKRGYKNIGENQRKHLRKSAADEILVLDKNRNVKVPRGVKTHLGKNYLKNLERFDVIFRSPGIPYLLPEIQKAEKQGVKISSATELHRHHKSFCHQF